VATLTIAGQIVAGTSFDPERIAERYWEVVHVDGPWQADGWRLSGGQAAVALRSKAVADACAAEPVTILVNKAGVAHYMPFAELPAGKADELLHVKAVAPTMLAHAAVPGMVARGEGTIINVSGMLAFSGPASLEQLPLRRVVYTGALAYTLALSQVLHEELKSGREVRGHVRRAREYGLRA
jgi:NAD(P)-dependent dehydrogenase (short-subunit alcohol dehydrogenase family)